jgi:hypothetical protein
MRRAVRGHEGGFTTEAQGAEVQESRSYRSQKADELTTLCEHEPELEAQ